MRSIIPIELLSFASSIESPWAIAVTLKSLGQRLCSGQGRVNQPISLHEHVHPDVGHMKHGGVDEREDMYRPRDEYGMIGCPAVE